MSSGEIRLLCKPGSCAEHASRLPFYRGRHDKTRQRQREGSLDACSLSVVSLSLSVVSLARCAQHSVRAEKKQRLRERCCLYAVCVHTSQSTRHVSITMRVTKRAHRSCEDSAERLVLSGDCLVVLYTVLLQRRQRGHTRLSPASAR